MARRSKSSKHNLGMLPIGQELAKWFLSKLSKVWKKIIEIGLQYPNISHLDIHSSWIFWPVDEIGNQMLRFGKKAIYAWFASDS